jgi:hypothetical protein
MQLDFDLYKRELEKELKAGKGRARKADAAPAAAAA